MWIVNMDRTVRGGYMMGTGGRLSEERNLVKTPRSLQRSTAGPVHARRNVRVCRPVQGALILSCLAAVTHAQAAPPLRPVAFDTDEGTFMCVDVSPDGKTLLFDLLGDLYTMPIEGGAAKPILTRRSWDRCPG